MTSPDVDSMSIPQHVAIIMDGNGRWAKMRGLPRAKGHEQGEKAVERMVDACIAHKVPWLTLYAFSAENWGRPKAEVAYLMEMLHRFLKAEKKIMMEKGIRLRAIGELDRLPAWEGDRIFQRLLREKAEFFSLKLVYEDGDRLASAILDGKALLIEK